MLALYRGLTGLAAPALPALLRRRVRRAKEDPARLGERWGHAGRSRPDGRLVWFHAASVGESLSVLPLIDRLIDTEPELSVLITSGTVTSAELLKQRLPPKAIHQFVPLDHRPAVDRFLTHWCPDLAIWVESELWPNLIGGAQARGIPTLLIQGRMSEKSHRTWRWLPGLIKPLLGGFKLVLAQTAPDAKRLGDLGARDPQVTGTLKFATPPLPVDEDALSDLRTALGDRPVFLAASTHPGEERAVVRAHAALRRKMPRLLTVVVPRHPDRGKALATLAGYDGPGVVRRSLGQPIEKTTRVYVADTMGELGLFYRLAPVAFIGGSLIPHGGQNPVEAIQLGCAVVHGPHMFNFSEIMTDLVQAGGALEVNDGAELASAAAGLYKKPEALKALVDAQGSVVAAKAGVLDSVLGQIMPFVPTAQAPSRDASA